MIFGYSVAGLFKIGSFGFYGALSYTTTTSVFGYGNKLVFGGYVYYCGYYYGYDFCYAFCYSYCYF